MSERRALALAATVLALWPASAAGQAAPPFVRIDGPAPGEQVGAAVAPAGDVNGDGAPDVIVGAPLASHRGREHAGAAYVVLGPFAP